MDIPRYTENRSTKYQQRLLSNEERSNAMHGVDAFDPKEPVSPDEVFRGEDGGYRPFRLFCPGDSFFHVHNGQEERSPSAKVFDGGFHCFGCAATFACIRTPAKEPQFPFEENEIDESGEDPNAFMPSIDWNEKLRWKFCVVHAPMGSGKTHQLARLVNQCFEEGRSVCLVSFRVLLAQQQASRLGLEWYKGMHEAELNVCPDYLVVSVNSLFKVGYVKDYDVVLFDEAGFIRRHFLSTTCTQKLTQIYERFGRLIDKAQNVVMLQDGITIEDVRFYTEVCGVAPTNRDRVSGVSFIKPVHIHPITYTTDVWASVHMLVKEFKNAYNAEGTCVRPFMIFCNQVNFCKFL